ncbi:MAG: GTP-binding protein [Candidatus Hodarchaeota archaeon]
MADEYDYLFKSIVVGDGGVGKTALTLRFSKGFFTEDYKMTIGVDFHVKTIKIDTEEEGQILVKLQIWDTGGQERFSSIRPMYYRGALGALLIFDLTSDESFEHLPQWIEEVRANVKSEVPLLLVGNKSDLVDLRAVSLDVINEFTKKFNLYYMETSAKTGEGVGDCFYILACLMVGSGVPDQLISKGIVFSPGDVLAAAATLASTPITQEEPAVKVSATSLEPEPEIEFAAPPVPESETEFATPPVPEPEIEFTAPPIPEPPSAMPLKPVPTIEPEPEIEFAAPPIPESPSAVPLEPSLTETSVEFEFKRPDEILAEEVKEGEPQPIFDISESQESPAYKPKTIPFTTSFPVPAPTPEEFQSSESSSESLVDYMAETILSKKEMKKLEKQRKKEEKEKAKFEKEKKIQEEKEREKLEREKAKLEKEKKIREKKEKAAKRRELISKEKKKKKEKIEEVITEPATQFLTAKPTEPSSVASTFFQTLSQKADDAVPSSPFIPFAESEKAKKEEASTLKIIPNVADLEPSTGPVFASEPASSGVSRFPSYQPPTQEKKKKEIIICKQCGAMLSSDYAFCNKCGGKL